MRSRYRHPTMATVSEMTVQGTYQNFAIDRVVYGKPAAEDLVAEAARLGAKRIFLVVSRTLDTDTTWVHEIRTVLGARYAGPEASPAYRRIRRASRCWMQRPTRVRWTLI
jgi:hypothetical protein